MTDPIEMQGGTSYLERLAMSAFSKERAGASFDVRQMTHLLNGGIKHTQARVTIFRHQLTLGVNFELGDRLPDLRQGPCRTKH